MEYNPFTGHSSVQKPSNSSESPLNFEGKESESSEETDRTFSLSQSTKINDYTNPEIHRSRKTSNTPSPPLPPTYGIMHCLRRFLETERNYLKNLEELYAFWVDSLGQMEYSSSIDIADFFSNSLQILNIHRKLDKYINDKLIPEMNKKPVDFCVVCTSLAQEFMELVDELKVNYVDFTLKSSACTENISKLQRSSSFQELVERRKKEKKNADIMSLFTIPIRQINIYPRFFLTLQKQLEQFNATEMASLNKLLETVIGKLDGIRKFVHRCISDVENQRKMIEIAKNMNNCEEEIILPHRKVLREAVLRMCTDKTGKIHERHVFLFNDILIIAKEVSGTDLIAKFNNKRHQCCGLLHLEQVNAIDKGRYLTESTWSLIVENTSSNYSPWIFLCNSDLECDVWINYINDALKSRFNKTVQITFGQISIGDNNEKTLIKPSSFFQALKEKKEDLGDRLRRSQKRDLLSSSIAPSGLSNEKVTKGTSPAISNLEQPVNLIEADELLCRIITEIELATPFRDFCHKHYNNENLSFWLEVEDFKVEAKDNPSKLNSLAKEIYKKYFTPGSSYELNIESKEKIKLQNSISNPSEDIFDNIQKSIWNLMISDVVPKFMQSKEYAEFKAASPQQKNNDSKRTNLAAEWSNNREQRTTMFFLNTYNMHHNTNPHRKESSCGGAKRPTIIESDLQKTKNDNERAIIANASTVPDKEKEPSNPRKCTTKLEAKNIGRNSLRLGTLSKLGTTGGEARIAVKAGAELIALENHLQEAINECSRLYMLNEKLTKRNAELEQRVSELEEKLRALGNN